MTKKNKSFNRFLDRLERRESAPSEYLHEGTSLLFKLTCLACPEQYDVLSGTKVVGYVRLRHGYLRCNRVERGSMQRDKDVLAMDLPDKDGDGEFADQETRDFYLDLCARALSRGLPGGEGL